MNKIIELLTELKQLHLQQGLETLSIEEKEEFFKQLTQYAPVFLQQQQLMQEKQVREQLSPYVPLPQERYDDLGKMQVKEGKVACLIVAGGSGSRLGWNGPKGSVPVMPVSRKTLFQVLAEKVKAASDWASQDLPLAIMTSQENHAQTVSFFEKHSFFGLQSISFFIQEELPLLDEQGNWFLEKAGKLATGPDGNGHAFHQLFAQGIGQAWAERGIEHVMILFVDNPLAHPFDFGMIGLAMHTQASSILKGIDRISPDEQMGVIACENGKIKVVEYFELDGQERAYPLSSTGIFCVTLSFMKRVAQIPFPLHLAWKNGDRWNQKKVGKCERFLFDMLPLGSSQVYVGKREESYAPLKNRFGDRSLETVQRALLQASQARYEQLTGKAPPDFRFELAPCFDYASEEEGELLKGYPLCAEQCVTLAMLKQEILRQAKEKG